jgi:hypothetical protein
VDGGFAVVSIGIAQSGESFKDIQWSVKRTAINLIKHKSRGGFESPALERARGGIALTGKFFVEKR